MPLEYSRVVSGGRGWTQVELADGRVATVRGTRSTRNNNPGNIEYGSFARSRGAIGTDGRFAVFPSRDAGFRAMSDLVFDTGRYRNLTLEDAIERYAPAHENDPRAYARSVANAVGVPLGTVMSDIPADRRGAVAQAMAGVEGLGRAQAYAEDGTVIASIDPRIDRAIPNPPTPTPAPRGPAPRGIASVSPTFNARQAQIAQRPNFAGPIGSPRSLEATPATPQVAGAPQPRRGDALAAIAQMAPQGLPSVSMPAKTAMVEEAQTPRTPGYFDNGFSFAAAPIGGTARQTSSYGPRTHPITGRQGKMHTGLDLAHQTPGMAAGMAAQAVQKGTVTKAGRAGGYGNQVQIDHGNGFTTSYSHLQSIGVKVGDAVTPGQQIGEVGNTGFSKGAHLHFEVRKNDEPIDPAPFVASVMPNVVSYKTSELANVPTPTPAPRPGVPETHAAPAPAPQSAGFAGPAGSIRAAQGPQLGMSTGIPAAPTPRASVQGRPGLPAPTARASVPGRAGIPTPTGRPTTPAPVSAIAAATPAVTQAPTQAPTPAPAPSPRSNFAGPVGNFRTAQDVPAPTPSTQMAERGPRVAPSVPTPASRPTVSPLADRGARVAPVSVAERMGPSAPTPTVSVAERMQGAPSLGTLNDVASYRGTMGAQAAAAQARAAPATVAERMSIPTPTRAPDRQEPTQTAMAGQTNFAADRPAQGALAAIDSIRNEARTPAPTPAPESPALSERMAGLPAPSLPSSSTVPTPGPSPLAERGPRVTDTPLQPAPTPQTAPTRPSVPSYQDLMTRVQDRPISTPTAPAMPALTQRPDVPARSVPAMSTPGPAAPAVPSVSPVAQRGPTRSAGYLGEPDFPATPEQPSLVDRAARTVNNNLGRGFGTVAGGLMAGPLGSMIGGMVGKQIDKARRGPNMSSAARTAQGNGFDGMANGLSRNGGTNSPYGTGGGILGAIDRGFESIFGGRNEAFSSALPGRTTTYADGSTERSGGSGGGGRVSDSARDAGARGEAGFF